MVILVIIEALVVDRKATALQRLNEVDVGQWANHDAILGQWQLLQQRLVQSVTRRRKTPDKASSLPLTEILVRRGSGRIGFSHLEFESRPWLDDLGLQISGQCSACRGVSKKTRAPED